MIKIKKEKRNMGKICWPNTGRGESHIPGALHCRSSTCFSCTHVTHFNAMPFHAMLTSGFCNAFKRVMSALSQA